tara:strand:+ start:829 stop:1506 length:678 start_codon:yes stop_codon:yes gene_type:complete
LFNLNESYSYVTYEYQPGRRIVAEIKEDRTFFTSQAGLHLQGRLNNRTVQILSFFNDSLPDWCNQSGSGHLVTPWSHQSFETNIEVEFTTQWRGYHPIRACTNLYSDSQLFMNFDLNYDSEKDQFSFNVVDTNYTALTETDFNDATITYNNDEYDNTTISILKDRVRSNGRSTTGYKIILKGKMSRSSNSFELGSIRMEILRTRVSRHNYIRCKQHEYSLGSLLL